MAGVVVSSQNIIPTPADFDNFIPWLSKQLGIDTNYVIIRSVQTEYVSQVATDRPKKPKGYKAKSVGSKMDSVVYDDVNASIYDFGVFVEDPEKTLIIYSVYDTQNRLIELKFARNITIPRQIFKLIISAIQYYPQLQKFSVIGAASCATIHDLNSLALVSNITEIVVDNSPLEGGNYYLFLENIKCLKLLTLTRCKIEDNTLQTLTSLLHVPRPASKTLCGLNLAHNRITDVGAKQVAGFLRSNRNIIYLNLANNWISDDGALAILGTLQEFAVTLTEIIDSRQRYIRYLRERNEMVAKLLLELKDFREESQKKKSPRLRGKEPVCPSGAGVGEAMLKAETMAEEEMGGFEDAFSFSNVVTRDGISYCKGNTTLAYINISYNHIGYLTVKKLLQVLQYQQFSLNSCPVGLIKVCIEGNRLPNACAEFKQIDTILQTSLINILKSSSKRSAKHAKHK